MPGVPSGDALRLSLTKDPAELARLVVEVERFLASHAQAAAVEATVQLALEELVSNVIRHSDDGGRELGIHVELELQRDGVHLVVEDDGAPFDPLAEPAPDVEASLDEREIGGLGIHLVRHVVSDLAYRHHDGRNRVSGRIPWAAEA
jgi:anti-sigma regulatory factor (Ser/Thr protein kinase)